MYSYLSRRQFLTAAALGALSGVLEPGVRRAQAQTAGSDPTHLVVARRTIEVDGKPASVFGLRQPSGIPGLVLDPGQCFNVSLENQTDEPTIIHWHGRRHRPTRMASWRPASPP